MKAPLPEELVEMFKEPDFAKWLKCLATNLGSETPLSKVYEIYRQNRPVPEQVVNGKSYKAGYHIFEPGNYIGTLIDIRQHGPLCKLMFDIEKNGIFLYHNIALQKLKVEQVVRLAQYLNHDFPVSVVSETIPQTGDKHAIIDFVKGLAEVLD